ncbi:MAG: ribonuclease III [Parachlamydiales bacterium]|nr:ribonuclease III [Parachlamydiales bacterium]
MEEIEKIKVRLQQKIGYPFKDRDLLLEAFTHKSFFHEHRDSVFVNNERLEFLGDAVLDLIAGEFLYKRHPKATEGQLSQMRSSLVNTLACTAYLKKMGVVDLILLGKGEKKLLHRGNQTIYSGTFEALLGAIFLDSSLKEVRDFFLRTFSDEIEEILTSPAQNFKALFQEYVQKEYHKVPYYELMEEKGLEHEKSFCMAIFVDKEKIAEAWGHTKKEAEQKAAQQALYIMRNNR